jgi:CheY-like chemotaxis protein
VKPESPIERPILVVEDDPEIRESLCDVLDSEGYSVVAAANGREALDLLGEMGVPCLILLDLMMPVMGGGEFLGVLRSTDVIAKLPVVVVSAWHNQADQVRQQAQGFVNKPVALDCLLDVVARFCVQPRVTHGGSPARAPDREGSP